MRSDIGAIDSGRWHASHLAWKIGATSLAKVGVSGTWPAAGSGAASAARDRESTEAPETEDSHGVLLIKVQRDAAPPWTGTERSS